MELSEVFSSVILVKFPFNRLTVSRKEDVKSL